MCMCAVHSNILCLYSVDLYKYIPFKHFRRCIFRLQWKMQILYLHRKVKKEWCKEDKREYRRKKIGDKNTEWWIKASRCANYARIITIFNFITSIGWNSKITLNIRISNWMRSDYRKSFTHCGIEFKRND